MRPERYTYLFSRKISSERDKMREPKSCVSRRSILTTGGVGIGIGLAGCQFREDDKEPRPSIKSVQAYQVAADQLVAILDFSKPTEDEAYTVPLRWEIDTPDLDQLTRGKVHLRSDYPSPTVSMAFMSGIEVNYGEIERSEIFWKESSKPWTSVPVNQDTYYTNSSNEGERMTSSPE